MENITYGEAKETDIPCLVSLLSILFNIEKDFNPDLTKQKNGLELLLNNTVATIQVARNSNGTVIGMVTAQLVISTAQGSASAWIEDMVVDSLYRGHGVGKQLLLKALEWAKISGATRAQLLVDMTNTDAIGYYEHLKWESTQLQARRVFL
ncbi:MAG: GNAT family N-acetyltransferase [Methylotenera sp. RIFCSPLOWO2_02_FULL_45_14]|nr:MAG: GNAT family N-acetyltransferase [Methylotenera sp. RIFCSPLOWO2_02_FULL_45_14]